MADDYTHYASISVGGRIHSSAQGNLLGTFSSLPAANAVNNGCVVLYAGSTTASYTKGKFYVSNGTSWSEYGGNLVIDTSVTTNANPVTSGAVKTYVDNVKSALDTKDADLSIEINKRALQEDLTDAVDTLEGADSALANRATAVENRATTLETEMDAAQGDITALQNAVSTKAESSALTNGIAAVNQTITTEVNKLSGRISALEGLNHFDIVVADTLPASGVENTLYLIPAGNTAGQDVKAEYLWVNNTWEKIGTTAITTDLTGYATEDYVNDAVSAHATTAANTYATKSTATQSANGLMASSDKTKLDGIATGAQTNVIEGIQRNGTDLTINSKKVNIIVPTKVSELSNDSNYVTSTGLASELTGYQPAGDYATKSELSTAQSTLQGNIDDKQDIITLTGARAVVSDVSGKLAVSAVTSSELGFVSGVTSSIQTQLNGKQPSGDYALRSEIPAEVTVDTALSSTSTNPVQNKVVYSAINTLSTAVSTLEGKVENLEGEVSTAKSYLTVTVTSATGNVTGRVITATPSEGSADTTATVGSGGSVTMTLNATSQYTVGCDAPEGYYAVPSQTITTATAGLVTNLTFTLVRKPVVNVVVTDTSNSGYQNGRTISVTGTESTTLTTDSAGKASYIFSKTGSVTFAMTNIPTDGDCDPVTITIANDNEYIVSLEISFGFVVGVRVKLSDGTVEYTDDAVGFIAASGTNLGSWVGHKLLEGFKPVQRSSAGAFTDLNRNDLTQTASGGVSSITSTVADAFLEVPLTWMHLSKDSTYGYIKFSNKQVDSSYTANAFYGSDGALKNCFHYGLFFSTNKSNKAYCFGGGAPTGSVSLTDWITYSQSRGEFFDLTTGCMDTFLIAMFVVLYKSLNGQTALAKGYTGGSSVQNNTILTFTSNNYGMAGSTSSDTTRMAFLWIHDFWGNMYQWVGGMSSNSSYKCCIQVGQLCTASNVDMNSTGIGPSSSVSGYLSSVAFDNDAGFYPLAANGSETTLFADYGYVTASSFPYRGGNYNRGGNAGPFYLTVNASASSILSNFGARLSYRGGRA